MASDGLTGPGSMRPGVSFSADDPGHGRDRTRSQEAARAGPPMGLGPGQGMGPGRMACSARAILRRLTPVTDPDTPRHIEIREGDHTIASATVMTCQEAAGTARIWLHAAPGHVPRAGGRAWSMP